jgi:hypothetical protein
LVGVHGDGARAVVEQIGGDGAGVLVHVCHGGEVAFGRGSGEGIVAGLFQALDDGVVGGRPHAAEPIAAVGLVFGGVGGKGGEHHGPPEFRRILEVDDEPGGLCRGGDAGDEWPETARRLLAELRAIGQHIIIETLLLIPTPMVDPLADGTSLGLGGHGLI